MSASESPVSRWPPLGVEYNYVHLDNESFDMRTGGTVTGLPVAVALDDVTIHTVMGRLSYKFGGDRAAPLGSSS
jgi:hypothetical protein